MKKILSLILSSALILMLASCLPSDFEDVNDVPDPNLPAPATAEDLYSLYNQVERDMTKSQIEALLGSGVPSYNEFDELKFTSYFNETKSAGVSVIYTAEDVVSTKMLYFNTKKNLVPFSGRFDADKISLIKDNMSVASACEVMGSTPLELSCEYNPDGPLSTNKIYSWYNEDSSNFMLHTEDDLITNVALYRS